MLLLSGVCVDDNEEVSADERASALSAARQLFGESRTYRTVSQINLHLGP